MFNVTVLRVKDLLKYLLLIVLSILLIILIVKIIPKSKSIENIINTEELSKKNEKTNEDNKEDGGLFNFDLLNCLKTSSVILNDKSFEDKNEQSDNIESIKAYKKDFFDDILRSQIGSVEDYELYNEKELSNNMVTDTSNNQDNVNKDGQTEETKLAVSGLKTEVITPDPIELKYNDEIGEVKIKNQTSYEISNDILNADITKENKNIILFHTHTCESYTPSEKYNYEETGNFRTTDLNYTVARVGDELENQLKQYGYNVIHDKTYHDYPAYNGSYTRSLETVEGLLESNPTDIIFDVHRDAIGSRSDYAPTVKIGEEECAQIMFVIGTDEGGLWHPNWQQNLTFAAKLQAKGEEMYPGLFKPLMLTKYRYNQHAGKYASIIEVGATGNTLEQCNNSMKYFAKVLDEVMK